MILINTAFYFSIFILLLLMCKLKQVSESELLLVGIRVYAYANGRKGAARYWAAPPFIWAYSAPKLLGADPIGHKTSTDDRGVPSARFNADRIRRSILDSERFITSPYTPAVPRYRSIDHATLA